MYEEYYGLTEKPFSILPDPDLIYWGNPHRQALAMLEFGVINNAGFTVLTGEIGSGKTTLIRCLAKRLPRNMGVGIIANTPTSRDELLQWIMLSLNQSAEGTFSTLLNNFQVYLRSQHASGRRTLLIVDEAQNLHWQAIEDLRLLSNVNADKHQLLQIILVGQPQLKGLINLPQMAQFAQRISASFHLTALSAADVVEYIDYRLAAVGAQRQLFSQEASALIAEVSGGIPRKINILCDTSLVYGLASNVPQITRDLVALVIEQKRIYGVVD